MGQGSLRIGAGRSRWLAAALACAAIALGSSAAASRAGGAAPATDTARSAQFFDQSHMLAFLDMVNCLLSTNCHIISNSVTTNSAQWSFPAGGGDVTGTARFVDQALFTVEATNSKHQKSTVRCPTTVAFDLTFTGTFDGHSALAGTVRSNASGGTGGYCGSFGGGAKPSAWHATLAGTTITGSIADQGVALPFTLAVTLGRPVTTTTSTRSTPGARSTLDSLLSTLFATKTRGASLASASDCGTGTGAPGPLCQAALRAGQGAADFLAARYGAATTSLDKRMAALWEAVSFAASLKDSTGANADAQAIGDAITLANFLNPAELSSHHRTTPEPAQDRRNIAQAENFLVILDAIEPGQAAYAWVHP